MALDDAGTEHGLAPSSLPMPAEGYAQLFHCAPVALLVLRADLTMVDANPRYLDAVGRARDEVVGHHVFDVFPTTEDDAFDLPAFFDATLASGETQMASEIRYAIPERDGTGYDAHWWNVVEVPVLAADGSVEYLLHYTEDVTELVRARIELTEIEASRDAAARRLAGLADVALALASTSSVGEVESTVFALGLAALDIDGAALVTRAEDGGWSLTTSSLLPPDVLERYASPPYDSDLPVCVAARNSERIVLPDRASSVAFGPTMARLHHDTERNAWAFLPLTVSGETIGALAVSWRDDHRVDDAELDVLEGFAAQCASALHRVQAAEAERRTAGQLAEMAHALQSALLTPPPDSGSLEVAVRYLSAVDATQVGGDWYDAFTQRGGAMIFVIGDVVGHDSAAAAAMGQLRSVLRVVGHTAVGVDDTPAGILTLAESVAHDLGVDTLATAVVVRMEHDDAGRRTIRWSNAGHPPPLMLLPDGTTTVLDPKPNLLLGMGIDLVRSDNVTLFPEGATLLLYTDGLVERRTAGLDGGIDDLRATLAPLARHSVEGLLDAVLRQLSPHIGDDDIAMLAVRSAPEQA